ncbi:hypothetical protein [Streptomyces zingiberis]|uniref:Adenylyl-sulfate kinase n=1 Tax=Streptomyces zingiberis TaxID=2053010 RepID=A0ABX1C093_9ACTN|nr:hypothetical protein [Streptomyces zingiberis]NJQ00319.1 hypothetical protein [Streptomyces zingiberis]
MSGDWPVLWLCGPSGVGKTSVGWEIFTRVHRAGITAGCVDADQLGFCYPAPADDPETHRVKAAAFGAVAGVHRAAGARCLVLSGGVQRAAEVQAYASALARGVPGSVLTVCRLRAEPEELRARFLGRGWRPELLEENLAGAAALERSGFADLVLDTTGLTVSEVARRVEAEAGAWPWGGAGGPDGPEPVQRDGGPVPLDQVPRPAPPHDGAAPGLSRS